LSSEGPPSKTITGVTSFSKNLGSPWTIPTRLATSVPSPVVYFALLVPLDRRGQIAVEPVMRVDGDDAFDVIEGDLLDDGDIP